MTELVSYRIQFCIVVRHFLEWKNTVMFYVIVTGSYLRSSRIRIWIWCTPSLKGIGLLGLYECIIVINPHQLKTTKKINPQVAWSCYSSLHWCIYRNKLTTGDDDWSADSAPCCSNGWPTACCWDKFPLDSRSPILHWLLVLQWFTQHHIDVIDASRHQPVIVQIISLGYEVDGSNPIQLDRTIIIKM